MPEIEIKKRTQRWFIARIGSEIIKNELSLFNPAIKIMSDQHAKALFLTQLKGHRYGQSSNG